MKTAHVNDTPTPATPGAPSTADCPRCGHQVRLRQRLGTWFWRHQRGAPLDCPGRNGTAPYRVLPVPILDIEAYRLRDAQEN